MHDEHKRVIWRSKGKKEPALNLARILEKVGIMLGSAAAISHHKNISCHEVGAPTIKSQLKFLKQLLEQIPWQNLPITWKRHFDGWPLPLVIRCRHCHHQARDQGK